jgi:hypothetical protein
VSHHIAQTQDSFWRFKVDIVHIIQFQLWRPTTIQTLEVLDASRRLDRMWMEARKMLAP